MEFEPRTSHDAPPLTRTIFLKTDALPRFLMLHRDLAPSVKVANPGQIIFGCLWCLSSAIARLCVSLSTLQSSGKALGCHQQTSNLLEFNHHTLNLHSTANHGATEQFPWCQGFPTTRGFYSQPAQPQERQRLGSDLAEQFSQWL